MCRKNRKEKERQLTDYENPQNIVEGSSYGPVAFQIWCKLEAERFTKSGLKPAIRPNKGGRIALFVN